MIPVQLRLQKWPALMERFRARRMLEFMSRMKPPDGAKIVDLGGGESVWSLLDRASRYDFHITMVNLEGADEHPDVDPRITYVQGDATDLTEKFEDNSFDIVFSNSVIEHVGGQAKQDSFAREVLRLAPAYWIQTPSDRSPIEPHTGVPFYWRLPGESREWLLRRWHEKVPAWTDFVRDTRVLDRNRMHDLFPDASVYVERVLGLEKSYSFYNPCA